MSDLNFTNNKFYYSALSSNILMPFLNSEGNKPTISDLLNGDLKIADKILKPTIDVVLSTIESSSHLKGTIKADTIFPSSSGIKAVEKMLIQTMFESHKPFADLIGIIVDLMAIAEHASCMWLGSSIEILGKEIGYPSRKPQYWEKNLNYSKTINYSLKEMKTAFSDMDKEFDSYMSKTNPIKNNVSKIPTNKTIGKKNYDKLYIGYFDNNGNSIDPPKWVKDSGMWLNYTKDIKSPFNQLSTELNKGTKQIKKIYDNINQNINREKNTLDDSSKKIFDNLTLISNDIINGTNYSNQNNSTTPIILNEWLMKVKTSQLRMKYFPEQKSTIQQVIDNKGKPKEPFVYIPKTKINYNNKTVYIETPTAYSSQISESRVNSFDEFYNKKLQDKFGTYYSLKTEVNSIDIFYNTDKKTPFINKDVTHFSHNKSDDYIPDNIKNYYLPFQWEEVYEYDIINTKTNKVVRKETEYVPFTIDIENDYDIRIIKVVNDVTKVPDNLTKASYLENIKKDLQKNNINLDTLTGTICAENNTIPDKNKSTKKINKLGEGIIRHGLDVRYLDDIDDNKVFWIVEATKKKKINNKVSDNRVNIFDRDYSNKYYNLIDHYMTMPYIMMSILPILASNIIPLSVKFLKLVNNPTTITSLLIDLGIKDENLSKFPKIFDLEFDVSKKNKNKKTPKTLDDSEKQNNKFVYTGIQKDNVGGTKSLIDGDGTTEIFGNTFGASISFGDVTPKTEKGKNDQPLLKTIFNFIKMPFQIIKKVFEYILEWVKKLLNPTTIASAIAEFLSFKWLIDILSKDSMMDMFGMDIDDEKYKNIANIQKNTNQSNYDKLIAAIRDGNIEIIEYFVYDIIKNGKKIGQEIESRPYKGKITKEMLDKYGKDNIDEPKSNITDNNPLVSDTPNYTNNEMNILYLKPLEQLLGVLKFIQEFFNALISMPSSILGIDFIPKFGEEIPFVNVLENIISELKTSIKPLVI